MENWTVLLNRAALLLLSIVLLFVAKFLRDLLLLLRGYKIRQIVAKDHNSAIFIDLGGYMLAYTIAVLSTLAVHGDSLAEQAAEMATIGIIAAVFLLIADWLSDLFIFPGINDHDEICEKNNIALAVSRAGAAIGTGLILASTLGSPDAKVAHGFSMNLLYSLLWFAVGQTILIVTAFIYRLWANYIDLKQISQNNVAAGLPLGGILIAVAISIQPALGGATTDWMADLMQVGIYWGVMLAGLFLTHSVQDTFLFLKLERAKEIVEKRNVGAGFLEAVSFVVAALFFSYFMS